MRVLMMLGACAVIAVAAVTGDVQSAYDAAYAKYEQGKYAEARDAFAVAQAKDPQGSLADNCQYWIAETYFSEKDFRGAVAAFRKVFTFADNNKEADAQLKLGYCFLKLGQREQAAAEFRLAANLFPEEDAGGRAAAECASLGR